VKIAFLALFLTNRTKTILNLERYVNASYCKKPRMYSSTDYIKSTDLTCQYQMMRSGWFHGIANLETVDPNCGTLDYIKGDGREIHTDYVMSNNFAFGGINTSLIFKRWPDA
jgi:hypothetical protein